MNNLSWRVYEQNRMKWAPQRTKEAHFWIKKLFLGVYCGHGNECHGWKLPIPTHSPICTSSCIALLFTWMLTAINRWYLPLAPRHFGFLDYYRLEGTRTIEDMMKYRPHLSYHKRDTYPRSEYTWYWKVFLVSSLPCVFVGTYRWTLAI
jgi:hypothetical protein